MGVSKTEMFSEEQNELATIAKALGHPARIAILESLLDQKTCVTGTLVDELPLSQSTVSQHLKELKSAGLIQGNIEGSSVLYCINPVVWDKAKLLFSQFFGEYNSPKESCC